MNIDISTLRINGDRLWQSLMDMAAIGGTDKGGCNRQALTAEDKAGRDLFVSWCREAGCSITVDEIGNIFAWRDGRNNDLPPVITGSHLDTQPTGGKFDGVYGVLAGLEVIRALNDADITTEAPLEVVVWTNEEGARFSPAMLGSGVWAGVFDLPYAYARTDHDGISVGQALEAIGYQGSQKAAAKPVTAAFEVHIEQGPILEQQDKEIGIVKGIQGMYWFDLTLIGKPCHAGPSPMDGRRDPFMALGPILQRLYAAVEAKGEWARVTFGDIAVEPASRNTVPETLTLAVDLRHPDKHVLDTLEAEFRLIVEEEAANFKLGFDIREEWRLPPTVFDARCVAAVGAAVETLQYDALEMVSGAGHDSGYIAKVAPTSMIFVPCKDGLSHNEAEFAAPEQIELGANVLLHAMLSCSDFVEG
ncbi:Zn-dependent hydrolase [Maricurvus nonylphenolicus]|uniref:Zn-dependent hydrolase n=1 Tax=Maricurvus nonylphenolicus TaxID=1008307 RepID=UPI0036F35293